MFGGRNGMVFGDTDFFFSAGDGCPVTMISIV